jgi:anti-anti-sigma factor
MLHTTVEKEPQPTVHLQGEMDLDCAETLRWAIGEAAVGARQVVLDFAGVRFIDSSGTGIFVRMCLDVQQKGVGLRVRNLTPDVAQVFDMLRVRELVGEEVFAD